ncbi:MAG: hypothetical protein ACI4DS_06780 [Eubacterium sp.]
MGQATFDKTKEYLNERMDMILDKKSKKMSEYNKNQLNQASLEQNIVQVQEKIDEAFEMFSPIAQDNGFSRAELNELQTRLAVCIQKNKEIDASVKELDVEMEKIDEAFNEIENASKEFENLLNKDSEINLDNESNDNIQSELNIEEISNIYTYPSADIDENGEPEFEWVDFDEQGNFELENEKKAQQSFNQDSEFASDYDYEYENDNEYRYLNNEELYEKIKNKMLGEDIEEDSDDAPLDKSAEEIDASDEHDNDRDEADVFDKEEIYNKIKLCVDLIDIDRTRVKLELKELLKKLSEF